MNRIKEENEFVVRELLKSSEGQSWQLVAPYRMATWERRGNSVDGLTEFEQQCLVRCLPEDGMNGFFVSLFVRKTSMKFICQSSPSLQNGQQLPQYSVPGYQQIPDDQPLLPTYTQENKLAAKRSIEKNDAQFLDNRLCNKRTKRKHEHTSFKSIRAGFWRPF